MKSRAEIIVGLKEEASKNPTFSAVCHLFAARQRTRYRVTLHNLKAVMDREGFKYTKDDYRKVLAVLAKLGVGTLSYDRKKRIQALDQVRFTLQSLGKAALGAGAEIKGQTPIHRFQDLVEEAKRVHAKTFLEKKAKDKPMIEPFKVKQAANKPQVRESRYPAFLTVLIDGKPVNFEGPKDLTADNLGEFLVDFKEFTKGKMRDV